LVAEEAAEVQTLQLVAQVEQAVIWSAKYVYQQRVVLKLLEYIEVGEEALEALALAAQAEEAPPFRIV
jgi:hypothetical protein